MPNYITAKKPSDIKLSGIKTEFEKVGDRLGALRECVALMHADNPADGWKDAIDAGNKAISAAERAGIKTEAC